MLKRLLRMIIILGVISGAVYLFYITVMMPKGYKDQILLVDAFINDIAIEGACAEYFNPETVEICETFQQSFNGQAVTASEYVSIGGGLRATLTIGDSNDTFTFTFIQIEETGLRAFFNNAYYYIDTVE